MSAPTFGLVPAPLAAYDVGWVETFADGTARRCYEVYNSPAARNSGVAVEAQESTDGTVLLTLRVDASPNMSANGAHKLAVELVEAADTMEDLADRLARARIPVLVAP